MVEAAEAAELEGIGFADHCYVTRRDAFKDVRAITGMNFDQIYDRRRRAIEHLRTGTSMRIYDAVEIDYDPRDRTAVDVFLEAAEFDYAIGSVHRVNDRNVQVAADFADVSEDERDRIVDQYYRTVVELVEWERFEILAHPDLPERTPPLRGIATEDHYQRVARALERSRTIPEINAGRVSRCDGIIHPSEEFLDVLLKHDVEFTIGSDAHAPGDIAERAAFLEEFAADHGIDPVEPSEIPQSRD